MARIAKTFKAEPETWEQLSELASASNSTMTAELVRLIAAEHGNMGQYGGNTQGNTQGNTAAIRESAKGQYCNTEGNTADAMAKAMEALTSQLEAKDRQISALNDALGKSHEALLSAQDSLKAAQTLHAATVVPELGEQAEERPERKTRWQRIMEALKG